MWSASSSKHASTSSSSPGSHLRRTSTPTSTNSNGVPSRTRQAALDEDAWKLDESDDEEESQGKKSDIAKFAAQAGLGRRASPSNLGLQAPPRAATASQTSLSSLSSTSTAAAGSSGFKSPSVTSLGIASSSKSPPPQANFKERGRQSSYGFWERISAFGSAKDKERAESPVDTSGYARFDGDLELEDNFDGTYSVNPASGSSSAPGLLAPATISRALGSGKVAESQLPSSATAPKSRTRSTDSPSGGMNATIIGTPRTRSPLGRSRKGERPDNTEDMRKFVRKDLEDVMKDPVNLLKNLSLTSETSGSESIASTSQTHKKVTDYYNPHMTPPVPSTSTLSYDSPLADHDADAASAAANLAKIQAQARRDASRKEKFVECLSRDTVDIAELRKHAWAGIPQEVRPMAWQLLLGYLPAVSSRRVSVLARKRQEYADAVKQAFSRGEDSLDAALWHQIKIDVPRTNPGVPLWQFASTQASLEKLLYVWAIRHPASGYVQGINDLATPFYQVFLSSYIDCDPEDYDISALPPEALLALEADTFWCLSKLLDGIQDNYIFAQPGIHRQVARCQELCARVDAPLAKHLEAEGVSFLQFSFRWFHLLFLRVLPVNSVIRMWDTYMSEGSDAFSNFHTYVCLAFLLRWSEKLRSMDFQAIMLFLQEPVDHESWTESSTELLLSEAYMWSALWSGSKTSKASSR